MKRWLRRTLPTASRYLDDRIERWRTGSREGQLAVLAALAVLTTLVLLGSLVSYDTFPAASFVVPMLLGSLLLRFRMLGVLIGFVAVCTALTVTVHSMDTGMTAGRISTLVVMVVIAGVVLLDSSRRHSGLPGSLSEAMLVDLNERLQAQGVVPPLPPGWQCETAMLSAGGAKFAGDFLVADLTGDGTRLEMVLVDVCGKGVAAGTQALQLAGALGGLLGSLPPLGLFEAANAYMLRQGWDEGFATAVHVLVRLDTGEYSIINAGHPPALHWDAAERRWDVDGARGTALGILPRPDFHRTTGRVAPGEALMFYTDGVVEVRGRDIDDGVDWLRDVAARAVRAGFDDVPRRVLAEVAGEDDDRAVLVVRREA